MSEREERFEEMLKTVQKDFEITVLRQYRTQSLCGIAIKMEKLKSENKTKTATYRQLMGKTAHVAEYAYYV